MPNVLMRVCTATSTFQPHSHFDTFFVAFSFLFFFFCGPHNGVAEINFIIKFIMCTSLDSPASLTLRFSRSLACNLIRFPRDFFICQFLMPRIKSVSLHIFPFEFNAKIIYLMYIPASSWLRHGTQLDQGYIHIYVCIFSGPT